MKGLGKTMLTGALVLALALVGGGTAAGAEAPAKGPKVRCKEVKAALAAGKTPEQVASELGIKVKRVKVCAEGRKGGKAGRGKQGVDAAGQPAAKPSPASESAGAAPTPAK